MDPLLVGAGWEDWLVEKNIGTHQPSSLHSAHVLNPRPLLQPLCVHTKDLLVKKKKTLLNTNPRWSAQQALATSEVLVPDSTEEELTGPACSCSRFAGLWMIGVSENRVIQTVLLGSRLLSVHQRHLPKPYNPSSNGLWNATPLLLNS